MKKSNAQQINSTKLYTETWVCKKILNYSKIIVQNAKP